MEILESLGMLVVVALMLAGICRSISKKGVCPKCGPGTNATLIASGWVCESCGGDF